MEEILEYVSIDQEILERIGIGFVMWCTLFTIINYLPMKLLLKPDDIKLSKIDELDVRNRIVSIVHGLGLVIFSTYHFYFKYASCGDQNTEFETNSILFSMSYFLYDFVAMMYYGLLDSTMSFHHIIVFIIYSVPFKFGTTACYVLRA